MIDFRRNKDAIKAKVVEEEIQRRNRPIPIEQAVDCDNRQQDQ